MLGNGAYIPGGMTGRGGFGNILKAIGRPLAGIAASAADGLIPGAGGVVNGLARMLGAGAYTPAGTKANTLLASPAPLMHTTSADAGVTIKRTEYLGDLTSSTEWELTQFRVNPGDSMTFPWLSTVANGFQKYKINGCVMYLRSTSSQGLVSSAESPNLNLGTVLGAFQYNVYAPPPQSKAEFLQLAASCTDKPSNDQVFALECDRSKNVFGNLLVRKAGVDDDLAKYDHAVFNLATVGSPGVYPLGELWISYDITLIGPKAADTYGEFFTASQATLNAFSDGTYAYCSPRTSYDPTVYRNTLGMKLIMAADGKPAWELPLGSEGLYQITFWISQTAGGTVQLQEVDGTGSFETGFETLPTFGATVPGTCMMTSQVSKIKPLLNSVFRFRVKCGYTGNDAKFLFWIRKVSSDLATRGGPTTSSSFMSPGMKVVREPMAQARMYASAISGVRQALSVVSPVLAPPTLVRQDGSELL
jgi:hypothetical protein